MRYIASTNDASVVMALTEKEAKIIYERFKIFQNSIRPEETDDVYGVSDEQVLQIERRLSSLLES